MSSTYSRGKRTDHRYRAAIYIGIPVLLFVLCCLFVTTIHAGGEGHQALASRPSHHLRAFTYTAVPGDTLQSLAAAFGIPPATIQSVNHLPLAPAPSIGQRLLIPWASHTHHLGGSYPSGTRHLIEVTARRFHVESALALAIAWQESRAQQQAMSSRQAIGLMQLEPATAEQVAIQLGCPIDLGNAYDNVTAGVYWLSYLLQYYHGDQQQAVAAYYEGQSNFARYGYLPNARRYMQSVLRFRMSLAAA